MRLLILTLIVLTSAGFWSSALAATPSARVEPFIGFKTAALSDEAQSAGVGLSLDRPFAGGLTGFRFGGSFSPSLSLGIEFAYGYVEQEIGQLMTRDAGLFVEHQFSIPLRTWLTYYFSTEAKLDASVGSNESVGGRGTKFGIGYTGFSRMSLNVEFLSTAYESVPRENAQLAANVSSILLSISSPINF